MITRRRLLQQITACGLATTAADPVWPQAAADLLMPEDVAYQSTPKGDQRCSNCSLFKAPNRCEILAVRIAPAGWCTAWAMK